MFLRVEEQDSICSGLNLPFLFTSKAYDMLRLHTESFTIKRTLTKIFASVSNPGHTLRK